MISAKRLSLLYRLVFALFLLSFLVLEITGIDHSCLDAADSTYLGSSAAIAKGMMPYRDFLLAHPPLLFVLGAPLSALGGGTTPFRIFTIIILAGLGVAVWRFAFKVTANDGIAMLAGVFTLFAPINLYFSKLFLNDPLVSLLAVLTFLLLFGKSRGSIAGAGVLTVLGTLTKLTWLPVLLLCVVYVIIFRRKQAWLFLSIALGGSLAAAVIMQLVTGGAYLTDILGSQASKGYSLSQFYSVAGNIWHMDWPLILPSAVGLWFAVRAMLRRKQLGPALRGRLFLLTGWLICGLILLATLPAEGHDANLFLLAEPALAVLAAWGIIGLAERRKVLAFLVIAAWILFAGITFIKEDRDFFVRSNADDVAQMVFYIHDRSRPGQPVLVPGCLAVDAGRPVALRFYDPFLWGEKYKRGDRDAVDLFQTLGRQLDNQTPPVVVLDPGQTSRQILGRQLKQHYQVEYSSKQWPSMDLWVPQPPG